MVPQMSISNYSKGDPRYLEALKAKPFRVQERGMLKLVEQPVLFHFHSRNHLALCTTRDTMLQKINMSSHLNIGFLRSYCTVDWYDQVPLHGLSCVS